MKIYYVYHSCFIVETDNSFFMFDYFKNKQDKQENFDFNKLLEQIIKSSKPLYVFASHNHQDHFNHSIFSLTEEKSNTYYILSSDIKLYNNIDNIYVAKQNTENKINNLTINTFGSTDEGVSFLIDDEATRIFHAGDLNWWKWPDDTEEEEKEMEDAFKTIIEDIIKLNVKIDVAFFPVDGRLEQNYKCGGEYFIEKLQPEVFIPMHFWDNFKTTSDFKNHMINTSTNIIEISHNSEIIKL
ncbi:MBL fold metallo-hydrolase [Sedimentibacter sp.]|uniref:MBL fold metallo-hydrolase n=1 Tax=Sedimentibacter sp. TaxID=1960295 RepID=UPI00289CB298|nr:MBL fold metallo-hydrolase [Sedimentibacter sp.]